MEESRYESINNKSTLNNSLKKSILVKSNISIKSKAKDLNEAINQKILNNLSKEKLNMNDIIKILDYSTDILKPEIYKCAINKLITELQRKNNISQSTIQNKEKMEEHNKLLKEEAEKNKLEIKNLNTEGDKNRRTILENNNLIDNLKKLIKNNKANNVNVKEIQNFLSKNNLIKLDSNEDKKNQNSKMILENMNNLKNEIKLLKNEIDKSIHININNPKFIVLNKKVGDKEILGEGEIMKYIRESLKKINYYSVKKQKKEIEIKITEEKNLKELNLLKKKINISNKNIENYEKQLEGLGANISELEKDIEFTGVYNFLK